jgi:curved DNA-binding protein CbpA
VDYYVVLGIGESASEETIRTAFRSLARRFHPDVGAGSSPVEFQRIREAYETLVDPERRRRYDRELRAARAQVLTTVESIVPEPVAEPLFDPRLSPAVRWGRASVTRRSLLDDVVEELFASLDDGWLDREWVRRRRWP